MIAVTQYPRAPITEAVIEIRFQKEISKNLIDKVRSRIREDDRYLIIDPWGVKTVQLALDVSPNSPVRASVADEASGYRASALDVSNVLIISTIHFSVSRLAPYTGWPEFYARARRDWEDWKKVMGYQRIARIGVRFINRVDIPTGPNQITHLEEYFTCYPEIPSNTGFMQMNQYAMQAVLTSGPEDCKLIINGSSVPSPLYNHASFVLDIDTSKEGEVPQNDDDLWAFVARMRDYKNAAFESCITDKARALFSP